MFPPQRIVCLHRGATVETLYLLGEEARIVGVSGYAVRPARVRREKPRVSAFVSADIDKIVALAPDLVLTFSDLQAEIAATLIRSGVAVHAFNQRDVAGILAMIRTLGALVGVSDKAAALADLHWRGGSTRHARTRRARPRQRPRALLRGMGRADDLRHSLGLGACHSPPSRIDDNSHRLASQKSAKDRVVLAADVIAAAPDIIVGSWCGKKFVPHKVAARPGFADIPAVRDGWLREIKSPLILQPGPAALTDGPTRCAGESIVTEWAAAGLAAHDPEKRYLRQDQGAQRKRPSGRSMIN